MTDYSLKEITLKTTIVYTVSYFVMGIMAMFIMDYAALFETPVMKEYMKPINDPMVRAGVLFQPLRGILFGLVFYAFREVIFASKDGWKPAWLMLVVVGIFSTFGPTPGSIEGFVYTKVTFASNIRGLPEILLQSFLLAFVTHYWLLHSDKKWLGRTLTTLFILVLLMGLGAALSPLLTP